MALDSPFDLAVTLIREFLSKRGCKKTLRCLYDELSYQPVKTSRVTLMRQLGSTNLLILNKKRPNPYTTLLEMFTDHLSSKNLQKTKSMKSDDIKEKTRNSQKHNRTNVTKTTKTSLNSLQTNQSQTTSKSKKIQFSGKSQSNSQYSLGSLPFSSLSHSPHSTLSLHKSDMKPIRARQYAESAEHRQIHERRGLLNSSKDNKKKDIHTEKEEWIVRGNIKNNISKHLYSGNEQKRKSIETDDKIKQKINTKYNCGNSSNSILDSLQIHRFPKIHLGKESQFANKDQINFQKSSHLSYPDDKSNMKPNRGEEYVEQPECQNDCERKSPVNSSKPSKQIYTKNNTAWGTLLEKNDLTMRGNINNIKEGKKKNILFDKGKAIVKERKVQKEIRKEIGKKKNMMNWVMDEEYTEEDDSLVVKNNDSKQMMFSVVKNAEKTQKNSDSLPIQIGVVEDLLIADIDDDDGGTYISPDTTYFPSKDANKKSSTFFRSGRSQVICKESISRKLADDLRNVVFGKHYTGSFNDNWLQQGFFFRTKKQMLECGVPSLTCGLIQIDGGPCGVLAVVQAFLYKEVLFKSQCNKTSKMIGNKKSLSSENVILEKALATAMSRILWQAGQHKICCVALKGKNRVIGMRHRSDGITEWLTTHTFTTFEAICAFMSSNLILFQNKGGVILFLYSMLLSRGLENVKNDLDEESHSLVGRDGYCSQEVVTLGLLGRARSNLFNGNKDFGGSCLKGIDHRSEIGLLSRREHFNDLIVESNFKDPIYPIWVIASESHYSSIFSLSTPISGQQIDMFYYDQLLNQSEEIRLTLTIPKDYSNAPEPPPTNDLGLEPPINETLRTKWPKCIVNWNDTEPIL